MDPLDPQRLDEELKGTFPTGTEQLAKQWPIVSSTGSRRSRSLHATLNLAVDQYQLHRYVDAAALLRKVVNSREQLADKDRARLKSAEVEDRESVEQSLVYAAACTWLALTYERLGNDDEAHRSFGQGVELFDQVLPQANEFLGEYFGEYGMTLYREGRGEEAIEYLRLAIDSGLTTLEVYRHLGLALKNKAAYQEAEELFRKALELAPDDPLVHKALGETFEDQEHFDEAANAYREAALAMASAGELGGALAILNHATTLTLGDPGLLAAKGAVLAALGRNEEALEALDGALSLEPENAEVLATKGKALLHVLGRSEEALEVLDHALDLKSEDTWILGTKGAALLALDRHEEALEVLDRALTLESEYAWAMGVKGMLLEDIAAYRAAVTVLDRAIEAGLSVALVLAAKGSALVQLGPEHAPEAQQAYKAAIDMEPDNLLWRKGLAEALYMLGGMAAGADCYGFVVEQAKSREEDWDAVTLANIGWCYYRLRQYDEAIRLYIDVLSLDMDMVSTQFDLALALVCNKRYSRGFREYKLALELTEGRSALPRHGLLDVAVNNLKQAMEDEQSPLAKAAEVQDELQPKLQAQLQALEEAYGEAVEDGQARLAEMRGFQDELRLLAKEFEETRRGWQPHAE